MTGYPILDIFLSILFFFGWVLWLMLMFWIITDIFRSDDLSGWAKAAWLVGVIILPLVGILIYLLAPGGGGGLGQRRLGERRLGERRPGGQRRCHDRVRRTRQARQPAPARRAQR